MGGLNGYVYIKDYETGEDAFLGLKGYFKFYNSERLHQSLGYRTPASVYFAATGLTPTPVCPPADTTIASGAWEMV